MNHVTSLRPKCTAGAKNVRLSSLSREEKSMEWWGDGRQTSLIIQVSGEPWGMALGSPVLVPIFKKPQRLVLRVGGKVFQLAHNQPKADSISAPATKFYGPVV